LRKIMFPRRSESQDESTQEKSSSAKPAASEASNSESKPVSERKTPLEGKSASKERPAQEPIQTESSSKGASIPKGTSKTGELLY